MNTLGSASVSSGVRKQHRQSQSQSQSLIDQHCKTTSEWLGSKGKNKRKVRSASMGWPVQLCTLLRTCQEPAACDSMAGQRSSGSVD